MNRNNNINTTNTKSKTLNKNKTNSTSSSRIQSASSDVFDNSDMDIDATVNNSRKPGRNLSSTDEPSANKIAKTTQKSIFSTTNRYSCLATEENLETAHPPQTSSFEASDVTNEPVKLPPSPPPITVQGVLDFVALRNDFIKLLGADNFLFKSSSNDLKILTKNSDSYRAVIKYLNEKKAEYHTYQQRENKAFRVVVRNIHPSTPLNEIGIAIQEIGYTVRQVANVRHKITKKNLPLFFVDLEPAEINKDIFHVTSILHTKIRIEEPHKRREIIQCQNCQKYGHSKSYCSHPPRCVRCAEFHTSSSCTKSIDQPPTCALCGGNHPANYRGCMVHKDLQKFNSSTKKKNIHPNNSVNKGEVCNDKHPSDLPNFNINDTKAFPNLSKNNSRNYSQNLKPNLNSNSNTTNIPPENVLTTQFSSFLSELKLIINPLIQLLTTVINKLILNDDK
uniref:Nucleic-acid-binding protein n=1 Tax=Schizaphis graminum TaxID=13262 RepID=A0A2S2PDP8_SCHGA